MQLKFLTAWLLMPLLASASIHLNEQQSIQEQNGPTELKHKLDKVIAASPFLSLHRKLVEIESISHNEYSIGIWLTNFLESHHFKVVKQEVAQELSGDKGKPRYNIYATPDPAKYGSKSTSQAIPKVLLTSHIDTVPPFIPYSLSVPKSKKSSYNRKDILVSGRGTVDAKACVAAQIAAAMDLIIDTDFKGEPSDIALLFVVGEEVSGDGMKTFSDSKLYNDTKADYKAIIFGEPTESKLAVGHKGIISLTIEAFGKAAHSGYPWLGRSANSMILPALFLLDKLADLSYDEGGLPGSDLFGNSTINVGYIQGGVAANVMPEHAMSKAAFRLAGGTAQQNRDIITRAIESADPNGLLQYKFTQGYGPVYMDGDVPGFEEITVNYGTDVPNLNADKGVRRYLFGPGTIFVAHGADEALTVGELESAVEDYKKLIRHAIDL